MVGVESEHCVVASEKFARFQRAVSGRVVMLESSIAIAAQLRSFALNVLPQSPQIDAVVLGVGSLTLGDEFTMHNLANVSDAPSSVLETAGSSIAKTAVWSLGRNRRSNSRHR